MNPSCIKSDLAEKLNQFCISGDIVRSAKTAKYPVGGRLSEEALVSRLKVAGNVWTLCKEFEICNPEILKNQDYSNAEIMHDRALLGTVKCRLCHIWLDAYSHYRERWPETEIRQLMEWILEGCESLAISNQYSSISSLIERTKIELFTHLDDFIDGCCLEGNAACSKGLEGCCESCIDYFQPIIDMITLLYWGAFSSRCCNVDTCKDKFDRVDAQVDRFLEKVASLNLRMECAIQCSNVRLAFGMRFLKEENYEQCLAVLHMLRHYIKYIHREISSMENMEESCSLLKKVSYIEHKLMVCLTWGHICHGRDDEEDNVRYCHETDFKCVTKALEGLYMISNFDDSWENTPDLQLDHSQKLDKFLESNIGVVRGIALLYSKLIARKRNLFLLLAKYAMSFQDYRGYRRTFLLSLLRNLCKLLCDSNFCQSQEVSDLMFHIISNKIVLNHVQTNLKLARNMFTLIWNASVDTESYTIRQTLLEVALTLGKILQDPELICQTLLTLSHINEENQQHDLAVKYAKQMESLSKDFQEVFLEVVLGRSEIDIETSVQLVKTVFSLDNFTMNRGIYFVCKSLDKGNFIMAGILLFEIIQICMHENGRTVDTEIISIVFQNFIALLLKINHPYLRDKLFYLMNWLLENPGLISDTGVFRLADQNLALKRYVSYHSFKLAQEEFRDKNYANASTSALFASHLLDPSRNEKVTFNTLLASQICSILGIHASYCTEDATHVLQSLVTTLKDRTFKIQKYFPEKLKGYQEKFIFYARYVTLLYHIKDGNDDLACETLKSIQNQMCRKNTLDVLHELLSSSVNLAETKSLILCNALRTLSMEPTKSPQLHSDILRVCLNHVDQNRYIEVVEEFHLLYQSVPKTCFSNCFIEWLYISCWNFGVQQINQPNWGFDRGRKAIAISLEGLSRAEIFCKADMEILRQRAERLVNTKVSSV